MDESVRESVPEGDDPLMQSLKGGEIFGTLRGSMRHVQAVLANARKEGRDVNSLSGEERQAVYSMLPGKGGRGYSRDEFETERLTARLEHLCRLIVRDRRPFCHVNGMLVLIPFAAAGSDGAADRTADDCRRDLSTARRVLKVYCPVYTLVCDLEKSPGFREFVDGFVAAHSKDHLKGRMGKHFPLLPDVAEAAVGEKVAAFVQWICGAHFPSLVYRLFRLEAKEGPDLKTVVQSNARLYRFVGELHERAARLGRIVGKCLPAEQSGPPMFGGCYFAGTGRDKDREQAFVPGIFHRLLEDQNYVAWSDAALAEEATYQRWAGIGYIILGALGIGTLAVLGWWLIGKR